MKSQDPSNRIQLTLTQVDYIAIKRSILKNLCLNANSGEILGVIGPSGAGKTSLFRIISGLVDLQSGKICFNESDLNKFSVSERPISYLQQSFPLYNNLTVIENVLIAFESVKNISKNDASKKTEDMLLELGINKDFFDRKPKNLSGGEAQRVALAKALLKPCKILLLDEPFSNIDKNSKRKFNQLIRKISKVRNLITLYISHAEDDLLLIADRVAFMENGEIVQIGTPEELVEKPNFGKVASVGSILGVQTLSRTMLEKVGVSTDFLDLLPNKCFIVGWAPENSEVFKENRKIMNLNNSIVLNGKLDRIAKIGRKTYLGIEINVLPEWQYVWHVGESKTLVDFNVGESVSIKISFSDLILLDEKDMVVRENGLLQPVI
jgi:ABC-type sugar transport system ATPase subunit